MDKIEALEIGDRFPETEWRCERHRGAGGWWPGQLPNNGEGV